MSPVFKISSLVAEIFNKFSKKVQNIRFFACGQDSHGNG